MKLFQLYPKALAHLTCKSPDRIDIARLKSLSTRVPFAEMLLRTIEITSTFSEETRIRSRLWAVLNVERDGLLAILR